MALARLSAIFILILYLKDSYGQQPGLGNIPGMGLDIGPMGCQQALQRKQGLISNPNILSQLSKPSNMGCSCNLKQQKDNLNLQQQGSQQSLNLQQTSNCQPSVQQAQSVQQSNNLQQFLNYQPSIQQAQNVQQSNNLQQFLNCQPSIQQQQNLQQSQLQSLPLNLQQQLLQQQQQQQRQQQQQQQQTIPVTNLQILGQQQPSVQTSDISFASLPIVNGQISSLPSQISQGVLLSNLGLQSSLPSILPNSCNCKQQAEQIPMFVSQNSLSPVSSKSVSIINESQFPSFLVPVTPSQPVEFTNPNNPSLSFMIPVNFQNNQAAQPNEQSFDLPQNSVNVIQSQPQQNRVAFNPVHLQSQPATAMQSQAVTNSIQEEPSISSLLLSQMQTPNTTPQCSGPTAFSPNSILNSQSNNQGSKSSSIKSLLPLLFNILKEKNSGCGCPQSCGPSFNNNPPPCGPITPNNNFNNNRNLNCNEPQVSSGYSNLINYGRRTEDTSTNNIESEESSKSRQKKRYKKYKYQYDDSLESTEADDEYDVDNED